jgi:DNA-binding transcriptional ArsR family regulator
MEKKSKMQAYGPSSPIYRLAKKNRLSVDEHDAYLEIAKAGREGRPPHHFVRLLKKSRSAVEKILKGLLKKGLVTLDGGRYMANFAKAGCEEARLAAALAELGVPVKGRRIRKSALESVLAAMDN